MSTRGDNAGKYHIKIKVTFKVPKLSKPKYKTGLFASEADFKKIRNNPRTQEHRQIHDELFDKEKKAKEIIKDNRFITPAAFERAFYDTAGYDDVLLYFLKVIKQNEADDKVGNADVYTNAMNSFIYFHASQDKKLKSLFERNQEICRQRKKFKRTNAAGRAKLDELRGELQANSKTIRAGRVINFFEVTPEFLRKYEKWMGDKRTACIMNIRCMKGIFNMAIADNAKKVPADLYPFARNRHEKNKYAIPSTEGTKFALSEEQLNTLLSFKSENKDLMFALDFWNLSYMLWGLNITDLCRLRFKDIQGDTIVLTRHKTRNTTKVKKKMTIPLPQEAKDIINRWGNRSLNPEEYIFPVLTRGQTARQDKFRISDFTKKRVNRPLAVISKQLKFPFRVTSYIARHTYATLSLIKGASILFIMEALGHNNPKTTLNYFHGFDIETKKRIAGLVPRG